MADTTGVTYPRGYETNEPLIADDPDEIRQQISHTRALMGTTITEIGERLSPDYILDKAKTSVREATVGRFKDMSYEANRRVEGMSNSVGDSVRANPLPVALIGLGLGWLLMSERSKRQSYDTRGYRTTGYRYYESDEGPGRMDQARYRLNEAGEAVQDRAAEFGSRVGERAQQIGENVSETAQRTTEAVRDTAHRVGETVGQRAEMAQERATDMGMQARNEAERLAAEARWRAQAGVQQTRQTFWEVMENNPLTLGAVVLIAGAAVGAAIPSTEYENRLLGETRDRLMEEARTRAQDTVGRVQTVLHEAQTAAVTEARNAAQRENLPIGDNGSSGSSNW
ncbi:MAG: DUF3618 domain-containing protein [Candidatus Promineofilum sp.]|nr:DUF3618 domain-containing protein [Promineifilum sp.]MCW5865265.1 DUF3618 domain-containing protein [Anaerolineae bacterium]